MKLSVIVPVYNVESYINKCLDSLLNQTYHNLEIILVDDGSTDRSGEICDGYALLDERVQVIHQANQGIVSARQAGIQRATGEYATNADPDDWIEAGAYEFMVKRLKTYHPDMLVLGYKKEYADFAEEYRQSLEDGFYSREQFWTAFNDCVEATGLFCQPIDMSLWSKAIRTELWKKHQMSCSRDLRKNVDDAVIFPCLLDIDHIYVESRGFYHYCVRKNSILWQSGKEDYDLYLKLAERFVKSYFKYNKSCQMDKKFLIYKLFYHLILDIPEKLFKKDYCGIYPQVKVKSNIIVYGKGVLANRLIDRMNEMHFAHVLDNIDQADLEKIQEINTKVFDYIVIAILNCSMAESAVSLLTRAGVTRDKVLCIEKESLTFDQLPDEVQKMWDSF